MLLDKDIDAILKTHAQDKLTTEKARRLILVLTGNRTTAACRLDRLPKECSIILHTTAKDCEGCGHFC